MISPILNSLAARPLWRLAPMAVIALGIMLAAVAWEAAIPMPITGRTDR